MSMSDFGLKNNMHFAKNSLAKVQVPLSYCTAAPCCPSAPQKCAQKEENNMDYNMEIDQRNHLKRRLDSAKTTKTEALRAKFHMEQIYPNTLQEIQAAIKNGQIIVDTDYFDADGKSKWGHGPAQTLKFADPARDETGYSAAKAVLDTAFTAAKDTVIVLPLADGLKALQAFEAQTF